MFKIDLKIKEYEKNQKQQKIKFMKQKKKFIIQNIKLKKINRSL